MATSPGISLPGQEIGSGCSGLPVLFGGSLPHFSLVEADSVWTSDTCNSLAHSKATCGPIKPFQEALGLTWREEQNSVVTLWFLSVLRSFRWMQTHFYFLE